VVDGALVTVLLDASLEDLEALAGIAESLKTAPPCESWLPPAGACGTVILE
jgi:hypothetical protein